MNQSQQFPSAPRRTGTYSSQHDELHLSGMNEHGQLSPRDYSNSSNPAGHIKLDHPPGPASSSAHQYSPSISVPNILQPGGLGQRPAASPSTSAAPSLNTNYQGSMNPQLPTYQSQAKPSTLGVATHGYSRSSPAAAAYDNATPSSYAPYTPTTPGGGVPGSSQYISPTDPNKYAPPSQRTLSNTPLGLADIRPRADSTMSDGVPGSIAYEFANAQPTPSNYLAPWALYAFDWCKWQTHGNSAGKVAIASYLEDGHNFVRWFCGVICTSRIPHLPKQSAFL